MENIDIINVEVEESDEDIGWFEWEDWTIVEREKPKISLPSPKLDPEGSFDMSPNFSYKSPAQERYPHKTLAQRTPDDCDKFPENIKLRRHVSHLTIEDVVREHALPFLPAKSLCKFRTVSKEWDRWINSPFLAHKQSNLFKDISGLFCQLPGGDPSFISFNPDAYGIPSPSLNFLPDPVNIRTTCNGLLCCQSRLEDDTYYICNPVNKEWKVLPKPNLYHGPEVAVALVFEPAVLNFAAHFELVCAVSSLDHPVVYFEIYSSRTSSWRVSDAVCCELDGLKLSGDGFYRRDVVYWETLSGAVLAFDMTNEEYGILPLPASIGPSGVLTEMHGELCYILPQVQNDACTIEFYGNMDMSLKCVIALDPQAVGEINGVCRALSCVNDDTLVLLLRNRVFAYHVRAQKMELLSSNWAHGYARYLPYVNSLVTVGHPLVRERSSRRA